MPSGFTLAVLREERMTCACVTMRARVHISVCGTQDRQDKTRQGLETTKGGGSYGGGGCPQNHELVRLARDTAIFWFRTAGRNLGPNRPKLGQQTPFEGKNWSKNDKKAAHMLPEWVLPMNGDSGTRWRSLQSRRGLFFFVILGRFWAVFGPDGSGPK